MGWFNIIKQVLNAVGVFFSLLSAFLWYLSSSTGHPRLSSLLASENNLAALCAAIAAFCIGVVNFLPENKNKYKELREKEETELDIALVKKQLDLSIKKPVVASQMKERTHCRYKLLKSMFIVSIFLLIIKK
jgi:hypothetical protein